MPDEQKEQKKEPQRVNLFLDPDIVLQAKMQALKEKLSLSKFIDKAVAKYIEEVKQ